MQKSIKIYNAGPLFSEYEVFQRKLEGKIFRDIAKENSIKFEIYNPIEFDVNPKSIEEKQPTPDKIFEYDSELIDKANVYFFDICNSDPGTLVELGMVFQKIKNNEKVNLYVVNSDFRVSSNSRLGFLSTIGFNSFVIGGVISLGFKLFKSFDEAILEFKKDFNFK